jgi:hypothetical protein
MESPGRFYLFREAYREIENNDSAASLCKRHRVAGGNKKGDPTPWPL